MCDRATLHECCDVMDILRAWAPHMYGRAIPAGHYLAEEALETHSPKSCHFF
jgi:hypothetical protein